MHPGTHCGALSLASAETVLGYGLGHSRPDALRCSAALCGLTRGHGILVSSGADAPEDLRPVADVLALVQLCGLTEAKAAVRACHNRVSPTCQPAELGPACLTTCSQRLTS